MKIMPTLQGGLRIDAETADDWQILNGITSDAVSCDENLALRLGNLITDETVARDWRDFVIPDLEETFSSAVLHVTTVVASARLESCGGPGPLWITRDDASQWYSTLNQARLALEERFHFGPGEALNPAKLPPNARSGFLRSQFYCVVQSLLLEHVM